MTDQAFRTKLRAMGIDPRKFGPYAWKLVSAGKVVASGEAPTQAEAQTAARAEMAKLGLKRVEFVCRAAGVKSGDRVYR